jgi:GNAT superfamily N-acetyltransferase
MEINLRVMSIDDAVTVVALSKQLGYEISVAQTKDNIAAVALSPDNGAFVAMHENNIAGWINITYSVLIESQSFCEIRGLIVDEKYRKNNIGKLLIGKAIEWSKEKHCDRLRVRCNVKRDDAHSFYRHLGFAEKKEQKVFEINI